MRNSLVAAMVLLFCVPAAQAKPFYRSKAWWVGAGVIATIAALDAVSTNQAQSRGAYETGWDAVPLIGHHPSHVNMDLFALGEAGVGLSFHVAAYHFTHTRGSSLPWRTAGDWTVPAIWAGIGAPVIVRNFDFQAQK